MTKSELSVIIKELYKKYSQEFDSMNKSEKVRYANELYDTVGKYDAQLVMSAILRIFNRNYPKPPNKQQLLLYVSRMLFERRSDVFIKMYDNGYYKIGLTGSEEEVSRKAFEKWDKIAIEFLKDRVSHKTRLELGCAVNEYDYLNEYRGLILFDDDLPIPPGCNPIKNGIILHPQPTYIHTNISFP